MLTLGVLMTVKAGKAENTEQAKDMLKENLKNGEAFRVFREFIRAQGGNPDEAEHPELLPAAAYQKEILSDRTGYVSDIHTEEIGKICMFLGGGRETKESEIDLAVGLVLCRKKGAYVQKGEPLAVIHANSMDKLKEAESRLLEAYEFAPEKPVLEPLIKEVIG